MLMTPNEKNSSLTSIFNNLKTNAGQMNPQRDISVSVSPNEKISHSRIP